MSCNFTDIVCKLILPLQHIHEFEKKIFQSRIHHLLIQRTSLSKNTPKNSHHLLTMGGVGQFASSGRGGAGNMVDSTKSPKIQPQDLETPTLKTSVVTTGRGGSGNMAKNVDPIETRARQDVQPYVNLPS